MSTVHEWGGVFARGLVGFVHLISCILSTSTAAPSRTYSPCSLSMRASLSTATHASRPPSCHVEIVGHAAKREEAVDGHVLRLRVLVRVQADVAQRAKRPVEDVLVLTEEAERRQKSPVPSGAGYVGGAWAVKG
ncbi:uncharacterized protein C8Q71DRAFT_854835 [Rhodofomes roseus]|uniref:Secreted protein n=1 Tax=Rhodofomes roseus TaxID=34475 RepID=A0ABQ8KSS6_9APHY|nr:uncharacterized protein C8Q71DRAFT_854835 [Rhodofomes roseus]KAH9840984.1 hypothetical protein C8Q71DRAFT_854835 [Rhodofomes roseus]